MKSLIFLTLIIFYLSPLKAEDENQTTSYLDDTKKESIESHLKNYNQTYPKEKKERQKRREDELFFDSILGTTPYRDNYFLPFTHNLSGHEYHTDRSEFKFQFSIKTLIADDMFQHQTRLFFGYTQRSFWQIYDKEHSRPFRETNYQPEIFFSQPLDIEVPSIGGFIEKVNVGFAHESNGQDVPDSRSWNRLFISTFYKKENLSLNLEGWVKIPEKKKSYPEDPTGDDNPDIQSYLGYGEMTLGYKYRKHEWKTTWRNNFRLNNNRGSILIGYSYPIKRNTHFYLQGFSGFGESLIDYNRSIERIGVGIMLNLY